MGKNRQPTRRSVVLGGMGAGILAGNGAFAQAAKLPVTVPIYDTHAHLISSDTQRYVPRPISGELRGGRIGDPVTPEILQALSKETGLKRVLAVQLAHTYGYDTDAVSPGKYHESYAADSAAKYPDFVSYTISVKAQDPKVADAIRYWVRQRKAAGVRFSAVSATSEPIAWFASDDAQNAWRAAADLNVPVCLHVFGPRRRDVIPALVPLAQKYPATPIVIDHLGNTSIEDGAPEYGIDRMFLTLVPHKNVILKFTSINLVKMERENRFLQPLFRRLVDVFGPDRLLWGSDIGNTQAKYTDMVRLAREAVAGLTDAQQLKLLYSNAETVYSGKWKV